jgi:acyl carrier protein
MLELDMDMEADLGIDSIKRVEILGALQEAMPDLPQPNLEDLGDLHTLNQIIEYLRSFDGGAKVDFIEVETQAKSLESLEKTLLTIVSEKTGYPLVSLNLEMNLQTDLGIDAVKRRAILDALPEQIPISTEIERSQTLAEILAYLKSNPTQKKTPLSVSAL